MSDQRPPQLIRHTKESYGDSFTADLFEQYKHYVESAEKISERRVSANNFLLTVNAFLVTLYGVIATSTHNTQWAVLVPIAGLLVSLTWYRIITSYRDLNTAKFRVIHELEQHMPAALYDHEWAVAEQGRGKAYHPSTHLERWIPIIFMMLYVLLATAGVLGWVPGRSAAPTAGAAQPPAATTRAAEIKDGMSRHAPCAALSSVVPDGCLDADERGRR